MSQTDSFEPNATSVQDDQSHDGAASITQAPTYSVAGRNIYEPPAYKARTASFVTPEYEQLNPNYNQPETTPIWGLAKPLPRIVRPGMKPRSNSVTNLPQILLPSEDTSAPDHAALAVPELEAGPSVSETQSPQNIRPRLFPTQSWAPRERLGQLRSQTSFASRLDAAAGQDAESHQRPTPISEEDTGEQQGVGDNIPLPARKSHESIPTVNSLPLEPIRQFSTHEFAVAPRVSSTSDHAALHRYNSTLSNERLAVDAARKRVQEYADTAEDDPALRLPTARIDWNELQSANTHTKPYVSEQHTHGSQERAVEQIEQHYHNTWAKYRHRMRQPLAEFLGSFVAFTVALSASVVRTVASNEYGNYLTTALAWGLGVMIGIYTCGGISGAHLNPAISIMLVVYRGFPWRHCVRYIIAQFLGAFAAAAVVYGLFRDAIIYTQASMLRSSPGHAFYTQPQAWISNTTAFFTEFFATAILACVILALGDDSNAPPGAGMHAFIIGLLVTTLSLAFSYSTGATLNPTRDLGPRLVTLAAGYGSEAFTARNCWWLWGCWVAPITGSLAGALLYDTLIFTGGESPINYPSEQWKIHVNGIKSKVTHGARDKGESSDEEKASENAS